MVENDEATDFMLGQGPAPGRTHAERCTAGRARAQLQREVGARVLSRLQAGTPLTEDELRGYVHGVAVPAAVADLRRRIGRGSRWQGGAPARGTISTDVRG